MTFKKWLAAIAAFGVAAAFFDRMRLRRSTSSRGASSRGTRRASDAVDVRERRLDETIEATFPASDPPANTVGTGVRLRLPS